MENAQRYQMIFQDPLASLNPPNEYWWRIICRAIKDLHNRHGTAEVKKSASYDVEVGLLPNLLTISA